jgi:hypothetical protein
VTNELGEDWLKIQGMYVTLYDEAMQALAKAKPYL